MKHKRLKRILELLTGRKNYRVPNFVLIAVSEKTALLQQIRIEIIKLKEYNKVLKENEEKVLHEPNGRKDFSFDHADAYDDDSFADWNC